MFSHTDIWRAIDRLAANAGFSASGLAKKSGLDPTTFNKSKRISADGKPRWPSTESIAKILAVTGSNMAEFIAAQSHDEAKSKKASSRPRLIPLLGFAKAGREGFFDEDGAPTGAGWEQISFPGDKVDEDTYALRISGDSMQPLYRDGDKIVVSPQAAIRRGDRVVVRIKGGEVMAKELAKRNAERVELKSLNAAHETRVLKPADITWIARIMWVSQ